jgi:GAF domain-containing protein
MAENEKKYEEVLAELEALVASIEDPSRDLAQVGGDIKKAMSLINWCREYVRGGEESLQELLKEDQQ